MEDNRKTYRLSENDSKLSVNKDTFGKVHLKSKVNLLPVGQIDKLINAGEQFDKERQDSSFYRLSGNINPICSNVLFNSTGESSWASFNGPLFRDGTFPSDGIDSLDDEDLTYSEAIERHLGVKNGWYGYQNPDVNNDVKCVWVDMQPDRSNFSLSPKNMIKNWEITITYPYSSESLDGDITYFGLLIVDVYPTLVGSRNMITFTTPVKHGLSQGENVKITGLNEGNGTYTVERLGENNGDNKEYLFTIEMGIDVVLTTNTRMVRLYNGQPSQYYFRKFKKVNIRDTTNEMETDDYEIYPLAFSQNVYEDKINHFIVNEDIVLSGLTDNLGRPISELFLTIIKTDSNGVFTPIKSGLDIPLLTGIESNSGIPDARRINGGTVTHNTLNDNTDNDVRITDALYYGDVAEYNFLELKEKILGNVNHVFNTVNRETGGNTLVDVDFSGTNIEMVPRYEGYMYNPHTRIEVKRFSSYIEQGTKFTADKPSYAKQIMGGKYLWRDLLDIGFNDTNENTLEYPFLNGSHYINVDIPLILKRQDPFNYYGLQHTGKPADIPGDLMDDNIEIKSSQDVC